MSTQTDALNTALAGRYRIDRELGRGGMATVYLADDVKHDRHVAIKVLKPELAAVLGAERFVVEIRTTAALQHPHILPLFDSGEAGGMLYYVMPYIEGETIRDKLNRETQFAVPDAVRIAREVADALDYAHRHGVIHRDIKPENILLHDGRAMVMDFGIALAVSAAAGGRMTETGLSLGTPHYMSPEQATAEKEITRRSDVYSLASVLYEMLAGQPPHVGGSAQQVIMRIITEPARPVNEFRKNVPSNVVAAIARALEKLPADRFENAKAFGDALVDGGFTHATSLSQSVTAVRTGAARKVNAREIVAWTIAAVALAGIGWYATRKPPVLIAGRFAVDYPDSVVLASSRTSTGRIAISRDGAALVFVATNQATGTSMLYLRRASDAVATPIRGSELALSPAFSPSGDAIVYGTRTTLRRIPLGGGTPQTLAVQDSGITYSSWGDDGRILYQLAGTPWRLMIVNANGGDSHVVATADTTKRIFQLRQPEMLPGSKYALVSFVRGARTANQAPVDSIRLGVISLSDGSLTDLNIAGSEPHYVAPGYVLFNRGAVVMAAPFSLSKRAFTGSAVRLLEDVAGANLVTADFAVAQNGWLAYQSGGASTTGNELWVVDLHGKGHAIDMQGKRIQFPAVSPDGKRVAMMVRAGAKSDVWTMDVASGALRPFTVDGNNGPPEWSFDGNRIYYTKGDRATLMVRASDGTSPESIAIASTMSGFTPGPAHGYSVVSIPKNNDFAIAPTDSLTKIRPYVTTPFVETSPAMSPDGHWLAYLSDASGSAEIVVRALPGPGPELPVSIGGGQQPHWSPNGKTLYYRGLRYMMAARISTQPQFAVTKRDTLFLDTFARGAGNQYSVFPNDRELLMLQSSQVKAQMFMVVNWQGLIGKTENVVPP